MDFLPALVISANAVHTHLRGIRSREVTVRNITFTCRVLERARRFLPHRATVYTAAVAQSLALSSSCVLGGSKVCEDI